ncbi:hypothetical protein B4119_2503 [Parageobacillus caldoxylosilyticus]|uniref:Uncharacterized protein n=1 Tax=Saccharococcus caldoxylosilyticus TaxID=81408 RepID=A0A150LBN0_9BACL|nr:hypothetical protein B4119_2503 [Parageobacillus caldoxylosilyticus]
MWNFVWYGKGYSGRVVQYILSIGKFFLIPNNFFLLVR